MAFTYGSELSYLFLFDPLMSQSVASLRERVEA